MNRVLVPIVLALITASVIAPLGCLAQVKPDGSPEPSRLTARPVYDQAEDLLKKGLASQALALVQAELDKYPDNVTLLKCRGRIYVATGRSTDAIQDFTRAIEIDRSNVSAYIDRAAAKLKLHQSTEALNDVSFAIKVNQSNERKLPKELESFLYVFRSGIYKDLKKNQLAFQDLNHAIELDGKNIAGYMMRGLYFSDNLRLQTAISDYSKALALEPKNSATYVARGSAYLRSGDDLHAIADFTQAVVLQPTDEHTYLLRGRAFANIGQGQNAAKDFAHGLTLPTAESAEFNRLLKLVAMNSKPPESRKALQLALAKADEEYIQSEAKAKLLSSESQVVSQRWTETKSACFKRLEELKEANSAAASGREEMREIDVRLTLGNMENFIASIKAATAEIEKSNKNMAYIFALRRLLVTDFAYSVESEKKPYSELQLFSSLKELAANSIDEFMIPGLRKISTSVSAKLKNSEYNSSESEIRFLAIKLTNSIQELLASTNGFDDLSTAIPVFVSGKNVDSEQKNEALRSKALADEKLKNTILELNALQQTISLSLK
jgi:tetratricopeptide (TPR) repeat protein